MQVDAVSLIICVIIYLHLGFSSGHGYAYRVPLTFGLTLTVMLSIVYTVLYMQDRYIIAVHLLHFSLHARQAH